MIKKYFLWIILWIIISPVIVYWIFTWYNLLWDNDNSDLWWINNDNWSLWGNFTYQAEDWNSLPDGSVVARLDWVINSGLYWDFTFSNLELIKNSTLSNCLTWSTYSISWTVHSYEAWWSMNFKTDSYYCPSDGSWDATLFSDLIWEKILSNLNGIEYVWASFNLEDNILIKWTLATQDSNGINLWWDIINTQHWERQETQVLEVSINKNKIDLSINKSIQNITKNLTPINDLLTINYPDGVDLIWTTINDLSSNNDIIYYYNYETLESFSESNENNKWHIIEISKNTFNASDFTDYQVWVQWKKTIIVKWWNIYINADIYNKNNNSILVLVAKRDSTNKKNWWNIYINPNVTNIDAILVSDWSIINYNWSDVVTSKNELRRQLYIYWSTFTKNLIWWDYNPYWSDWYIKYWKQSTNWKEKYDLTQLRFFNLIASNDTTLECPNNTNLLVPRSDSTSNSALKYAWAWKRECYNEPNLGYIDNMQPNLRWIDKFNPVIIEYNSLITTNPPEILKNK